jgi:UDP-N-acetylglucosamine 4,6-dehydratase (inverting)
MGNMLKNKTILLTGGTGSFGNKFTEIVLKEYEPKVIRIFSRGEKKQLDMMNKFNDDRLRFFIGDVRDKDRLHRAMTDVDIVVHAAALKQVPACEYNPIEAVRTNIDGSINIIDATIDNEVERVMAISTDKAVHPVNLYGATKMTAEKLFVQGNSYAGKVQTKFSCVRYGNVIGSRGSVIPLFLEQKKKGMITITDEKMTRFWITLEQGVRFVINCIDRMKGGEIFVPRIPSMKITDLAEVLAPNAERKVIGIRPGEKIHEVLLTEDEARHSRKFEDYFVIEPDHPFWNRKNLEGGKMLPEGFQYTSDNNTQWFKGDKLLEVIKEECYV